MGVIVLMVYAVHVFFHQSRRRMQLLETKAIGGHCPLHSNNINQWSSASMSGLSVVPYSLAAASQGGAGAKPSKKRKKRSSSGAAEAGSLMADSGWTKVDIEDMQIEGFQDGCAFELEELTDYRVQTTEDGGKLLFGDSKSQQEEQGGGKKKKRRKSKAKKQQANADADTQVKEEQVEVKTEVTTEVKTEMKTEAAKAPARQQKKQEDASNAPKKKKTRGGKAKKEEAVEVVPLKDVKLPKWNKFKLHPLLMQSLQTCGFSAPTRIQERTLLPALVDNRDVVGAAPTGSGKTLAFGLPILSQLLHEREQPGYTKDCKALILTPTRAGDSDPAASREDGS